MSRYIDADKLIEELQSAKNAEWNKNDHSKSISEMIEDFCTELKNAPTADVIPESEVDNKLTEWADIYEDTVRSWDEAYEKLEVKFENAKSEAAKEIFDWIESNCYGGRDEDNGEYVICIYAQDYDKLKEKYTK